MARPTEAQPITPDTQSYRTMAQRAWVERETAYAKAIKNHLLEDKRGGRMYTIAARDLIGTGSSNFGETHDLPVFEGSDNAKRVARNHLLLKGYDDAHKIMKGALTLYTNIFDNLPGTPRTEPERGIQLFEKLTEITGIPHNLKPQAPIK